MYSLFNAKDDKSEEFIENTELRETPSSVKFHRLVWRKVHKYLSVYSSFMDISAIPLSSNQKQTG